jgi:hypothetical protein
MPFRCAWCDRWVMLREGFGWVHVGTYKTTCADGEHSATWIDPDPLPERTDTDG